MIRELLIVFCVLTMIGVGVIAVYGQELAEMSKSVTAPVSIEKPEIHKEKAQKALREYQKHLLLFQLYVSLQNADEKQKSLIINIIRVVEGWD